MKDMPGDALARARTPARYRLRAGVSAAGSARMVNIGISRCGVEERDGAHGGGEHRHLHLAWARRHSRRIMT